MDVVLIVADGIRVKIMKGGRTVSDKQFLSIKECVERHGISHNTIEALFKRKGSPAIRVGRKWQVDIQKWDEYLLKLADADKG